MVDVRGGLVMSLSPRIRNKSDMRGGVCNILVTLVPTFVISLMCFKLNTLVIATASIVTYLFFR